jgi:hypothetical protein
LGRSVGDALRTPSRHGGGKSVLRPMCTLFLCRSFFTRPSGDIEVAESWQLNKSLQLPPRPNGIFCDTVRVRACSSQFG